MRQDVSEMRAVSLLELLRRASTQSDLSAWAAFQQGLEETALTWLHAHPGREAACRVQSERHFVALAFEQLWQAVVQRQVACETLTGALLYLRASLCGAILEMQRASRRQEVSLPLPEEPSAEEQTTSRQVWEIVQTTLPDEREQRLAYLLFHCGLGPQEIVRNCPQEWSDVREVAHLRHTILKQLTKGLI